MMEIHENISLKPWNSFGIEAYAKRYSAINSTKDLATVLQLQQQKKEPLLIVGGGSNILFTNNFNGWVLHNQIKGIELVRETAEHYYVKAGAGESWHELVSYCVEGNMGGIENLSLIPGSAGAAPMQNIGAYGVEIKDVFEELEAIHLITGETKKFSNSDCCFGYRESVFKRHYKHQFIITSITLKLSKQHKLNTSYGAIEQELNNMNVSTPTIQAIAQAVINIRQSKLPNPQLVGNAGSFFKNPVIATAEYDALKMIFPNIPGYANGAETKVPAGWLIEQCGWKGYRKGDAGCYPMQALVLVNYGKASGTEILALSQTIIESVQNKFSITLEREVNIV